MEVRGGWHTEARTRMQNILRRLRYNIFPPPRWPVTWKHAIPLAGFLAVFGGACLWLEMTNKLMFAHPAAFWLLILTGWVWWMSVAGYAGLTRSRSVVATLVRLSLLGVFIVVLAEPRSVRIRDILSVIYAVDVSDSIGDGSTDAALQFVTKNVSEKPQQDEAGLVVFGRNAAVELPPRITFPLEAINSQIDRDATNLEQSLALSAAMLPEENQGRIVLISDGTSTEGSLSRVLDELKSRGVSVDVLPIQYAYDDEVWLERLELPQFVKLGETYEATILLSSLKAGSGNLILRENGKIISEEPVKFQEGKNKFTVPISLREAGYYEYAATIEVPRGKDNLTQNNSVINSLFIEGEGKVLLVVDPNGDERDWQPLAQAIREGERAVEVRPAYELQRDATSLMPYDCIAFVNVAYDNFDGIQLQAVRDAVYDLGIGFLMVGGQNSFGPGGYHRTLIEDVLPVSMDVTQKKVLPKGALAIILHTCEFAEGNTWAKRITKEAVRVLGAQDEVGAICYGPGGGDQWIFEMTPASEYEKLVPKINAAQPSDMPSFTSTMAMGLKGLMKTDASARHMIIISDGDPSPPPPQLVQEFIDAKVSISIVAIFPHGGVDIPKLRAICSATGGRFYFPSDPKQLPAIFIKESKSLKRSMIQNKTFTPEMEMPSPILKGIEGLPPLRGFVLTSPKNAPAMTILKAPPDNADEPDTDPVLATWRYGLGSTAAFTSDLSPNWGANWLEWQQYRAFVKQLLTHISREGKASQLRVRSYTNGNEGVIIAEDFHPQESFLEVHARISGPRDRAETILLKQIGPRRYQGTVPLWGKGRYHILATGVAGERNDRAHGSLILPYSPEYLKFRSSPIALQEIADRTGGELLTRETKAQEIYQTRRMPKKSSRPIFDWFLVALACLVPFDVAIRRIQLDWYVIKGWLGFGLKRAASTATMGALLERKQAVSSELQARRAETPLSSLLQREPHVPKPSRAKAPATSSQTPTLSQSSKPAAGAESEGTSTTERLLKLKRKRQEGS